MTTTPEENVAPTAEGAATARPRRRRAASRPAGPPVRVQPESAPAEPAAPTASESTPAVEPPVEPVVEAPVAEVPAVEAPAAETPAAEVPAVETPAVEAPVEAAAAAEPAPRRRTRRATRKVAAPAETVVEPAAAAAPAEDPSEPAPAPATAAEPVAEALEAPAAPARRRRSRKAVAAAPLAEASAVEAPAVPEVEAPRTEVVAVAEDAPVEETPVETPVAAAVEAPAAPAPVAATAPAAPAEQPDLMDDPVLLRAAGFAQGRRAPSEGERAADAAARATALFFQAPVDEAPTRRSRRASAPAGPPPVSDREAPAPDEDDDLLLDDLLPGADDEAGEDAPELDGDATGSAEDGDEEQDEDGGAPRRRRRRGGRGRRSRTREDGGADTDEEPTEAGEVGEASDGSDDEEPEAGASASDDEEDEDGEEPSGSSRRRRRRRRRSGAGETEDGSPDDPPNTVTRVREPRRPRTGAVTTGGTGEDEITALKGSTRLEAKKQRRREGREQGRKRAILTEAEFLARREAVERVMVVRQQADKTQIGVLEDGILVEHYGAKLAQTTMVGNVYLGRVQNVLPSMEAAFIDVGKGRNAVLYAGEVNWDAAGLEGQPRRIEAALKSGDPVLVQVTKDPVGHKGARLTSQVSLPGRYLVYVPRGSMTGISRKLPDTERARLKKVLKQVVPEGAGVIVRTAAEGVAEEELAADVQRLQATWEAIQAKASSKNAPVLLHGEPDLTVRVVRDVFNEDFTKLVISGDEAWETVRGYVDDVAPDLAERLERWDGGAGGAEDVFAHHRIDEQLQKALGRKVWLPSGGSLVIDPTEAMHVVDVNTGKFTGAGGTLEETVTRNNLEAAEEIVRQLRLRDIGGIIVIDFIDMVLESNRDLVLRRLVECLGRDRTKHQVAEVTSLGLVQMTRKRTGQGLAAVLDELDAAADANPAPQPALGGSSGGPAASGGSTGGNGAGGKSRARRGRGRDKGGEGEADTARSSDAQPGEGVAEAGGEPPREPGKDSAVLAAIAAVAAAARSKEREESSSPASAQD
ncbi:ribonuclease E [Kineococcus radiotolerans]|uniref:Ribonuclease E n=1 Tax=Kineococcus radiotolerans TaxID=131568 RepID=A0A7W4TNX1_KINRA|nr:Rne/Rng family ribonuclease [Kineococcus radiotolerans]MBB2901766.1 ribonuclease E [Kineococcus radiotolerans]